MEFYKTNSRTCIGVDLTYKAEELGYKPNLILGARQINNGMAKYVTERTHDKKRSSNQKCLSWVSHLKKTVPM